MPSKGNNFVLYGITGGVGMGKSTTARFLRELGIPVIDTDDLARAEVEPGRPGLEEVLEAFGRDLLQTDGSLHRGKLASIVFKDSQARKKLEAILHPRIRKAWKAEVENWPRLGRSMGAVVIPLLFETGAESEFDGIVCVACKEETQKERLSQRGWGSDQIAERISAQWPVAQKIEKAKHVIWSEGTLEMHRLQVAKIIGARPS